MGHSSYRYGIMGIALIAACGAYGVALAQSPPITPSPSSMSAVQGASSGLGDSHRFASPAAASAHCSNDTIVWSVGGKLTYEVPGAANYGKGSGFYACKAEADDAGFQAGN